MRLFPRRFERLRSVLDQQLDDITVLAGHGEISCHY